MSDVILYYVEVSLDNLLDFDKKSPRHISEIRIAELARLKTPLANMLDFKKCPNSYKFGGNPGKLFS